MECSNIKRALLQMGGEDGAVLEDAAPAPPSTQVWNDSQELQCILCLLSAYLLFFGQCGFAFQEAGCVRSCVSKQVPFKVLLQAALALLTWWALGHGLAFGERPGEMQPNGFVGSRDFFLSAREDPAAPDTARFAVWMTQATYAATAVAIASGALAERARLLGLAALTLVLGGWVYPVVVHWVWSSEGWLSARREAGGPLLGSNGLIDLGGSGALHVTAGAAALAGAYAIGARQGRFAASGEQPMPAGSMVLVAAGVVMRWFSFYGLVPANVPLMATTSAAYVTSRVAVAVTLAGAAGAAAAAGLDVALRRHIDHRPALDGALAGLVAISAGASVVEPYAAFVIGALAGPIYLGAAWLVHALRIDDPLNAAAVHLLPGCWGLVAAGFFATPNLLALSGYADATARGAGLLYGGDGRQLGLQLLGAAVIAAWALAWMTALLLGMRWARLLRVGAADEMLGWYGFVDARADVAPPDKEQLGGPAAFNPRGGPADFSTADMNRFLDDDDSDACGDAVADYYGPQRAAAAAAAAAAAPPRSSGSPSLGRGPSVGPAGMAGGGAAGGSPRSPRSNSMLRGASCVVTALPSPGVKAGAKAAAGAGGGQQWWGPPSPHQLRTSSVTSQIGHRPPSLTAAAAAGAAPQLRAFSPSTLLHQQQGLDAAEQAAAAAAAAQQQLQQRQQAAPRGEAPGGAAAGGGGAAAAGPGTEHRGAPAAAAGGGAAAGQPQQQQKAPGGASGGAMRASPRMSPRSAPNSPGRGGPGSPLQLEPVTVAPGSPSRAPLSPRGEQAARGAQQGAARPGGAGAGARGP